MSGIEDPGTPDGLPEEYADIYRDAYLRALAEDPEPVVPAEPEVVYTVSAVAAVDQTDDPASSRRWLIALLVAILLIIAAFGLGRVFSTDTSPGTGPSGIPATPAGSSETRPKPTTHLESSSAAGAAWTGGVQPVAIVYAAATCTAPAGLDSTSNRVQYDVSNAIDSDPETAWRCKGTAVGQTITFTLPPGTAVAEVGLIPGYAKTDPASGTDRYAENNRISRVRWRLGNGVVITQRLDPSPTDREVQAIRVPRTVTGKVTLVIAAVRRGSKDTTAISSVVISRAS